MDVVGREQSAGQEPRRPPRLRPLPQKHQGCPASADRAGDNPASAGRHGEPRSLTEINRAEAERKFARDGRLDPIVDRIDRFKRLTDFRPA